MGLELDNGLKLGGYHQGSPKDFGRWYGSLTRCSKPSRENCALWRPGWRGFGIAEKTYFPNNPFISAYDTAPSVSAL
jgi:hypothetical protein